MGILLQFGLSGGSFGGDVGRDADYTGRAECNTGKGHETNPHAQQAQPDNYMGDGL